MPKPFENSCVFSLSETLPHDPLCAEGYEPTKAGALKVVGPPGRPVLKPLREIPKRLWVCVKPERAIYRFEVGERACPEVYVGKASSLRQRVADYVEMTRRALALFYGNRVTVDKNGLRYVHYWIAKSLVRDAEVWLRWYYLPPGEHLAREEQLRISEVVCEYARDRGCGYGKVMNGFDAPKSDVHRDKLDTGWEVVRGYLVADPDGS